MFKCLAMFHHASPCLTFVIILLEVQLYLEDLNVK